MPILKNNKHELFAQALAKGKSQIEAYGLAGYKPDKGAASRLSTNVNVQARVGAERAGGKARLASIDAKALETTVAECSKSAVEGRDPAFGRGSRAYNRYQGDALHGPNPCIAPVERGPFYAIKLVIGDLGTYGGIRTHEHPARSTPTAASSRAFMPLATIWRASWGATILAPASRSVRL